MPPALRFAAISALAVPLGLSLLLTPLAHANPFATLFDNGSYAAGPSLVVSRDIPSLGALTFGDRTSSIRLRTPVPIAVYKEADYKGACKTITGDVPSLAGIGFGNDNLSSVRIQFTCENGPVAVDACASNPCAAGQVCVDKPRPAPNDASGRTCYNDPNASAPTPRINVAGGAVAANTAALPNLARGRPARALPLYGAVPAARLTDGFTHGDYSAGTVTHTMGTVNDFMEVDLGAPTEVATVVLHNRTDCCPERLATAVLEVSAVACDVSPRQVLGSAVVPVSEYSPVTLVRLAAPASGRFLCLRQTAANALQLAEIEAFGPETKTQRVPAVARQSSVGNGGLAARVIDGNTNGNWSQGSVNHTATDASGLPGDSSPWVEVDLRATRNLERVLIYNRTDGSKSRLTGARLELSLDPCNNPARRVVRDEQLKVLDRHWKIPPYVGGAGYNAMEAAVLGGRIKRHLAGFSPDVQAVSFLDAPAARYLCLRHDVAQFLHVAEIEAYEGDSWENITRRPGVTARQVTTYSTGTADLAIDGKTWGRWEHGSVTHTTQVANPWLEIDLGAMQPLRAIVVHNRTDAASERLLGALIQTSRMPCDAPGFTATRTAYVEAAPFDNSWTRREPTATFTSENFQYAVAAAPLPYARNEENFIGETARYVCVRIPRTETLSVAEVEVFGTGFETPAPPAPTPTPAAALASTPSVPTVAPVATQVSATQIQVTLGAATLACSLDNTGPITWNMSCAGGPPIAMTGSLGSSYDLVSESALTFADLTAGPWFPSALQGPGGLFDKIVDVLGASQVKLAVSQGKGFHLRGVIDLGNVPGAGVLSDALKQVISALKGLVSVESLDLTPTFELVPSVTGTNVSLALRVNVITACISPPSLPVLGTALKFNEGAVTFALGLGPTGLTVTAGLASKLYLKPSRFDPWLMVTPGFELGAAGTGGTLTVRGAVSGRCEETCAATCGCQPSACSQGWSPFGMSQLSLAQGFVELGAKTVGAVPVPSVKAAFQEARVGDVTGSFAIAFDTSTQQYGFRFGADRLPMLAAFQVFGGPVGDLARMMPKQLALRSPLVSFASTPMELYGVSLPKGMRVRGGVDLGALGLRGSVDATMDQGTPDLGALAQGKLVGAMPGGALKIQVEVPDIAALVVRVGGLSSFARSMVEATFWVTKLELAFTLTANEIAVGAAVDFRLLGEKHDLGFSLGASWDLDDIISGLATKVVGLVGGALVAAFNEVKAAAETAYRETSEALKKGAAVVINGIVTCGSIAIAASEVALGTIDGYATKAWNGFKSVFGL